MKSHNFVVTTGKASIDKKNTITYIPSPKKEFQQEDLGYEYCSIRTDIKLSEGELSFNFRLKNKKTLFK